MKNKLIQAIWFMILMFSLASCGNSVKKEDKAIRNIHQRLISFKDSTVMEVDSIASLDSNFLKKLSSEDLNEQTDTIFYSSGEIYVSFLLIVNGCTRYGGNIDFKKDTLFLKLDELSDTACTEVRCDRLVYKISNPKNEKYIIKKY